MALMSRMKSAPGLFASVCRRLAEREHSLARDTCDCDALVAAIFAGDDSNSREGHVQTPGEKASERFIRAAFQGRRGETDFQRAGVIAFDGVAARPRLDTDAKRN